MDRISHEHRSWNMSKIRSRDTTPEIAVRSALHSMGLRFRLHNIGLPGKPDIVLQRFHIALFVHGCYWHRHPNCKYAYHPKSNIDFWSGKFSKNTKNDKVVRRSLRKMGWHVYVIWECQTKDPDKLRLRLKRIFSPRSQL
jgi:DNA mismatch endonuclease (patch repair protein)